MMAYVDFIGFAAGFLTTVALLPQAFKAWTSKSTKDVSIAWIVTLTTGVVLWLVYGLLILSWPVIAANFFTLILCLVVLFFKMKYG